MQAVKSSFTLQIVNENEATSSLLLAL